MANDEPTLSDVVDAINFMSTYPTAPAEPGSAAPPTSGVAISDLQRRVMAAIQGVLGRSFRPGDYRTFRAALEVSFEYKEVGGRSSYEWKPRAYPTRGTTDIGGGISGAQSSLVSFANSLHERAVPIIDQLRSLKSNTDEQELEAARNIFRTALSEFVNELSREGGPRAPRANELARSIFDTRTGRGHIVRLGLLIGTIQTNIDDEDMAELTPSGRFLPNRRFVVTTEEEEILTSFITLADYYFAIDQSWDNYRRDFFQADLGTGLLTLERQLSVLEETINETYVAFDSVNIDQAERLAILIDLQGPYKDMSVEDLLSWIVTFASSEAPQLIRDGGKWGVEAILPTARRLRGLTNQFISRIESQDDEDDNESPVAPSNVRRAARRAAAKRLAAARATTDTDTDDGEPEEEPADASERVRRLPEALNHPRVLNPLHEVAYYLNEVVVTAQKIIQ